MKKGRKKKIIVCICIYIIMVTTDFTLAKLNKEPVFAIIINAYIGATVYNGIGYMVIEYPPLEINGNRKEIIFLFGWKDNIREYYNRALD